MRAAVYHGPRDIRVEEVDDPRIAEDEILVPVRACGICGSDMHMLKQNDGCMVLVALFEQAPELDLNQVVRKHITIRGSWTWTGADFREAIALVASGRVDRKSLISHEYVLEEATDAFATQDQPEAAIKVLLTP